MKQNPHLGSDALAFLESIIPDTPETRLVERQELFRIALTQAMRNARRCVGLTQKELAQKLNVGQSWVSKLESANNDHTFESVIAYLDALGADFETSIFLNGQKIAIVAAKLGMTKEEVDASIYEVLNSNEDLHFIEKQESQEFIFLPEEERSKCDEAQAVVSNYGLWGTAA